SATRSAKPLALGVARHGLGQVLLLRARERHEEPTVRALESAITGRRSLDRLGVEALVAVRALDLEARLLLCIGHRASLAERNHSVRLASQNPRRRRRTC